MYLIQRTDQGGGYVAQPGSKHTYTHDITQAQTFTTKEAADAQRCKGNEATIYVNPFNLLQRPTR